MGYVLPQKIRALSPYQPVSGEYQLHMDANESCFGLPDELRERIAARLGALEYQRYPDPDARECCRLAAARYRVAPEQVVAGNGSDELIGLIESCLLPRGGKLVTLEPDFSMYGFYASLAELEHTVVAKREDGSIDLDHLIETVNRAQADMLIFSNPCNPTSLLLPQWSVERLVQSVGALVVVDEAYMDFADGSAAGLIGRYDNLMVLKTCSKAVGLAAARMGFALADEKLIAALRSAKSPYNVNALTQAVAAEVLAADAYVDGCAARLVEYTRGLYDALSQLQGEYPEAIGRILPTETNFVYLSSPMADALHGALQEKGIAVRLMQGHLRISTGTPQENARLLEALREILGGRRERV